MKIYKLTTKILAGMGCLLLLGIFLCAGVIWGTDYLQWMRFMNSTSPLTAEVILDLCQKFIYPNHEPICSSSETYAYEFYPFMLNKFESGVTDYSEVEEVLGAYQWDTDTEGPLADGRYYFIVRYDLRGDRKSALALFFYEDDGKLIKSVKFYEGID